MVGESVLPYYHDPETNTEIDTAKDIFYAEEVMKKFQAES